MPSLGIVYLSFHEWNKQYDDLMFIYNTYSQVIYINIKPKDMQIKMQQDFWHNLEICLLLYNNPFKSLMAKDTNNKT